MVWGMGWGVLRFACSDVNVSSENIVKVVRPETAHSVCVYIYIYSERTSVCVCARVYCVLLCSRTPGLVCCLWQYLTICNFVIFLSYGKFQLNKDNITLTYREK